MIADKDICVKCVWYNGKDCRYPDICIDLNKFKQAKLRSGKWENPKSIENGIMYCSVCRNEAYWDTDYGQQLFDYCPYCGAKMIKP